MAASKVGLTFEKLASFKNDSDVTWCQHGCAIPQARTYSPDYKDCPNTIKGKMEQDRIPGWKQSPAVPWAAIQEHLTLRPVSHMSGLWQANNPCDARFTKYLDLLPMDIAKTHQGILRDLLGAPVAAVLVGDPTPTRHARNLSPSVCNKDVPDMLIQLLHVLPVRALSVSG